MWRYIVTGSLLMTLSMGCEEKKTNHPKPPAPPEKTVEQKPATPVNETVQTPVMALQAKVVPEPVHYEDVTARVFAEGKAKEKQDQALEKIKEKALARLKQMQAEAEEQVADSQIAEEHDAEMPETQSSADMKTDDGAEGVAEGKSEAKADPRSVKDQELELVFRKARDLAKFGRIEEAKAEFLNACQAGHAHACHKFAWYEEHAGNMANALRFYRAACDGGLGKSCNNLAFQFERQKIWDKAADLYAKGCMDKHEAACVSLKRVREEQQLDHAQEGTKAQ